MPNIVRTFLVNYDGNDADENILEARALGKSITGASKLYTAIAHYSAFGFVPRGRYRKNCACYVRPATPGSWDQLWAIAPLAGEYGIHAKLYNQSISYIFKAVVGSVKLIWPRPSEATQVAELLSNQFHERTTMDHDLSAALAAGLVKSNVDLASISNRLIDTLPLVAESTRAHGRDFVQPIGGTCSKIVQFPNESLESSISESDAEVIRGDAAMELGTMETFRGTKISEVDIRSGHCVIDVEGIEGHLIGKIMDPGLKIANNMYTSALNNHAEFTVKAKAVRQNGKIKRLYISDADDLPGGTVKGLLECQTRKGSDLNQRPSS